MYLSGCSCLSRIMGSVWRRRERAAPSSRSSISSRTICTCMGARGREGVEGHNMMRVSFPVLCLGPAEWSGDIHKTFLLTCTSKYMCVIVTCTCTVQQYTGIHVQYSSTQVYMYSTAVHRYTCTVQQYTGIHVQYSSTQVQVYMYLL